MTEEIRYYRDKYYFYVVKGTKEKPITHRYWSSGGKLNDNWVTLSNLIQWEMWDEASRKLRRCSAVEAAKMLMGIPETTE